jgi:antitoxin component of MazEF toxin-antitoxin module
METRKIIKVGNSKAVNIPANFCKKLNLTIGDYIDCWLTIDNEIAIIKHDQKGKSKWIDEK